MLALMLSAFHLTTALVRVSSTGQMYPDLPSALASLDPILDLSVTDSTALSLPSFGSHLSISLACNHSELIIVAPVVLPSNMIVLLHQCQISCDFVGLAAFSIFGSLEVQASEVRNCTMTAFLLYGALHLSNSLLSGNQQPIVATQVFGFTLIVENCHFHANSSPFATAFYLAISSFSASSHTNFTVSSCLFTCNSAGFGSVLLLRANPSLQLPAEFREITLANSIFTDNQGIPFYLSASQLNVSVTNITMTGSDTAFFLVLNRANFSLSGSYFEVRQSCLIATYVWGEITLTDIEIGRQQQGASVQITNSAPIVHGLVHIQGILFHLGSDTTMTWTIACFNVVILVENLRVVDGEMFGAPAGLLYYSVASIKNAHVANLRLQGAIIFSFFSQTKAENLYVENITMQIGGIIGSYFSHTEVSNLTIVLQESNYQGTPKPLYGIIVAHNSQVTLQQATISLPPIANYPSLYAWGSSLEASNLTFTQLYSDLATVFEHSQASITDVYISCFRSNNLALASRSNIALTNITLRSAEISSSLLSALHQSSANLSAIHLLEGSAQSLVRASGSTVLVTDLHFTSFSAPLPLWCLVLSRVVVQQVAFYRSAFDLAEVYSSSLTFRDTRWKQIRAPGRFLVLVNGSVSFEHSILEELEGTLASPLCSATKGSFLSFIDSHLAHISHQESSIVKLSSSSFLLHRSNLTDFSCTFALGDSASVTLSYSYVESGGPVQSYHLRNSANPGFLGCLDCLVSITECSFSNLTGKHGGVLSLTASKRQPVLTISHSLFLAGRKVARGGFIYAENATIIIEASLFDGGKATQGGAIFLSSVCDCVIWDSNFTGNWAMEGGVLYWTEVRPNVAASVLAINNTAVYGEFEASMAAYLALLLESQSILIGLFDVLGQLVKTDNTSTIEFQSEHLKGPTTLVARGGRANFSELIIWARPGETIRIQAFALTLNESFPEGAQFAFTHTTRLCVPGEVTSPSGCFICPEHTFSVNPNDTLCTPCPNYASCPGGSALVLSAGYWRESNLSAEVFRCPIAEACQGGANSTCGVEYTGVMCARCDEGYYYTGLSHCGVCEFLAVQIVRLFLVVVAALALCLFSLCCSKPNATVSLKILLEFLQCLLILPAINVDWTPLLLGCFSYNEMLFSFGLSSLALDCLLESSSLPTVLAKALLASLLPLLLLICLSVFVFFKHKQREALRYFLVAVWYLYPYIVKSALPLLTCREVNGRWLMLTDVSIPCFERTSQFLPVAVPIVIIYVLGVPLGLLLLLTKRRNLQIQPSIRFFLEDYKENRWYAAVISLAFKALFFFMGIALSAVEFSIQILSVFGFLYTTLHLFGRYHPYKVQSHAFCAGFGLLLLTLVSSLSLYFSPQLEVSLPVLTTIAVSAFVLVATYTLALARETWRQWRRQEQVVAQASATPESSGSWPSLFVPLPSRIEQRPSDSATIVLSFPEALSS